MSELRKDPVAGTWVVVGYKGSKSSSVGMCPFCPGNENLTPPPIREFKDQNGMWLIRCIPALDPIFKVEAKEDKHAEGLYDKMGNVGAHEIIVENRSHTKTLSSFTEKELTLLIDMYIDRIVDLKKDIRFRYIQIFKNHGELAGSYIYHPHSHILATHIMPQKIESELNSSKTHYMQKERCLFCDIINQEMRVNKRIVTISSNFVAICPFASRFPFEVWIFPRFHNSKFEDLRDAGQLKDEFVSVMHDIMKRIEPLANAYTIIIHTSPNITKGNFHEDDVSIEDYFHWHVEILPRDFRSSKYKMEDQFYVVSLTPEEAASALKAQKI